MSLTGSRYRLSRLSNLRRKGLVALALYNKIVGQGATSLGADIDKMIDRAAKELKKRLKGQPWLSGSSSLMCRYLSMQSIKLLEHIVPRLIWGCRQYRQGNDTDMSNLFQKSKMVQ
ncbi:MAG: hypothetical protein R2822_06285 [Spirosomataceae bacterium]